MLRVPNSVPDVNELIEKELIRQRIERFTQFFSRVNSAFSFRKVTMSVEASMSKAPAWSTANHVTFNSNAIGDLTDARAIAGIKGLDLHEISHILFTPRNESELVDWVIEKNYWVAFNALEDQRIETLFTTKYPSTIDWFTATIMIHFIENQDAFKNSYPLLRGRRYLPIELRKKSREVYPEPENIDAICEIVDRYRQLVFPTDTEEAKDLIERFFNLLPKGDGSGEGSGSGDGSGKIKVKITQNAQEADVYVKINDPFGHGQRGMEGIESNPNSRPIPPNKQKRDSDRIDSSDKSDDRKIPNKPVIELNADDLEFVDDENASGNNSGANNSDQLDQESGDPDQPSNSAGSDASDLIETILNDILTNAEIAKEINDIIRQVNGLPTLASNNSKEPEVTSYRQVSVDPVTFQATQAFTRELERLKSTFDPYWEKYQESGRIDPIRYERGDDLDTIFDRFNEGRDDATEIECVIILDNSGSMQGDKASKAYRAMYAIKRSLDRINARTSVLTFNHETKMLYRASDQAKGFVRDAGAGGGTDANDAITYATKLLAETDKPVRIFFAITDGEWSGDLTDCHDQIERMARAGVLTAFAYIPDGSERVTMDHAFTHGCEIGAVINNPMDLIGMARKIVRYAINRRLVNR